MSDLGDALEAANVTPAEVGEAVAASKGTMPDARPSLRVGAASESDVPKAGVRHDLVPPIHAISKVGQSLCGASTPVIHGS